MSPLESLGIPEIELHLFNTETRQKERFQPREKGKVTLYACGPTVYDFAHIGNFRTYIFEDLLRRTLKFFGYQVVQVMNITDVDDKTIRSATQKSCSLDECTTPFMNAFFVDLKDLGIDRVEFYPRATDYMQPIIDSIAKLIDKGVAYQSKDRSVYFKIDAYPKYGRLSRLNLSELSSGSGHAGNASDEYDKENIGDFVLWKAYDKERDGDIYWESPFGKGRPGWHMECSVMALELLGQSIDLHVGGVDNIFPHHENEIAQSECLTGKTFVGHWLHSEHLLVESKKMSKSLGNFYTLRDLMDKGYSGTEVRYMLLHTHYRTQLNFTMDGMQAARHSLKRLNDFVHRIGSFVDPNQSPSKEVEEILQKSLEEFAKALADDLNISVALASLFDLMHKVNLLEGSDTLGGGDAALVMQTLFEMNRVLNLLDLEEEEIPSAIIQLHEERLQARKAKDFARADALRDAIHESGYEVEDTPHGSRVKKI